MMLAIGLLLLAAVLVVTELAIPSFGILGIAAATAYAFALVKAFEEGQGTGWTFVGLGILLLPITIALGLKLLPMTPVGKRLFLPLPKRENGAANASGSAMPPALGERGIAFTDLRPAGTAEIQGRRIDVVSSSRFIDRGTPVVVVIVAPGRVVVEPVPSTPDLASSKKEPSSP